MELDLSRHVGAVVREVASREHEGKPARVVIATRSYATDIDDAWDALTNVERIPRWFLPVEGDLRLGGHYQLKGNAGGTITRCEPPRALALTWEFGGATSWVNVHLREEGPESTRLELEHIAHEDPQALQFWDQFGPGAVGVGWDLSLVGLAEHLEAGRTMDHEEGEAWLRSENGKAFVAASSGGWAAASIAWGTDAEAAQAAAERTTAFYTGG
jgi:uncharacterized protein YndB with AHSA1/START domain